MYLPCFLCGCFLAKSSLVLSLLRLSWYFLPITLGQVLAAAVSSHCQSDRLSLLSPSNSTPLRLCWPHWNSSALVPYLYSTDNTLHLSASEWHPDALSSTLPGVIYPLTAPMVSCQRLVCHYSAVNWASLFRNSTQTIRYLRILINFSWTKSPLCKFCRGWGLKLTASKFTTFSLLEEVQIRRIIFIRSEVRRVIFTQPPNFPAKRAHGSGQLSWEMSCLQHFCNAVHQQKAKARNESRYLQWTLCGFGTKTMSLHVEEELR